MKLIVNYSQEDATLKKYEIKFNGLEEKELNSIQKDINHLITEGEVLNKIHPNPFVEAIRIFLSELKTDNIQVVIGGDKN